MNFNLLWFHGEDIFCLFSSMNKFSLMAFVSVFALAPWEAQRHIFRVPLGSACLCTDLISSSCTDFTLGSSRFLHYFILLFHGRPFEKGTRHKGRKEKHLAEDAVWSKMLCQEGGSQVGAFILWEDSLESG